VKPLLIAWIIIAALAALAAFLLIMLTR